MSKPAGFVFFIRVLAASDENCGSLGSAAKTDRGRHAAIIMTDSSAHSERFRMSFLYIESPPFLFTGERLFSGGDLTQQIIKYSVILPPLHYIKLCRPLSCRLRCISVVYAVNGVKREISLAKREKSQ